MKESVELDDRSISQRLTTTHTNQKVYQTTEARLKALLKIALALLLVSLPFKHSKGLMYTSEAIIGSIFLFDIYKNKARAYLFETIRENPFIWIIGLYSATVLLSVFFSFNPIYSAKQFVYEIIINVTLFFILIYLYQREFITLKQTLHILILTNLIFISIFLLQGLQWYLFPSHPLMRNISRGIRKPEVWQIFFELSRYSDLFSYKAVTTYVLFFAALGLAYLYLPIPFRDKLKPICLGIANVTVAISSMLKAPIVAIGFAIALSPLLPLKRNQRIKILYSNVILIALFLFLIFFSPLKTYFLRGENLTSLVHGKYRKWGSFGSRIIIYKTYVKQILKHPFIGVGIGRRNIKFAFPDSVKESRHTHAHNVFLNVALQQGIQSVLMLFVFIFLQLRYGISILRTFTAHLDSRYIYVLAFVIWICMFWTRSSFDDMFRHSISTYYWVLMSPFTFCLVSTRQDQNA